MKKLKEKINQTLNPNLKDEIKTSPIDHAWAKIVGNAKNANS